MTTNNDRRDNKTTFAVKPAVIMKSVTVILVILIVIIGKQLRYAIIIVILNIMNRLYYIILPIQIVAMTNNENKKIYMNKISGPFIIPLLLSSCL